MTKSQLKTIENARTIRADLLAIIVTDPRSDAEKAALFGLRDASAYRSYANGGRFMSLRWLLERCDLLTQEG